MNHNDVILGRKEIWTDVPEITESNIISVLSKAMGVHAQNVARYNFLLNYEAGEQPLQRTKSVRPEIDIKCIDNIANEVTEFKLGFLWGNPITFVQRDNDRGSNIDEGVAELNAAYESAGMRSKRQQLARYVEITNVGYIYIDINTDWSEGDSYFTIEPLDPRFAFVVKSSYYMDHRHMLGVTYRIDDDGNAHITAFTKTQRFEINNYYKLVNGTKEMIRTGWSSGKRSGEKNPLGMIPIVEWFRSYDMQGCFERQIDEMDNLNILISDFSNDVDQNTQVIWHANDVDFPKEIVTETTTDANGDEVTTQKEVFARPESNDWISTNTSPDGKQPFIKPLSIGYDYTGILNNILSRRALILQKCFVPQRNDNSGGSTGIAMSDATGWSAAETQACKQQLIMEVCAINELKVVLAAIKKNPHAVGSKILDLKYSDVLANIKRQKTYELTVKTNALATLIKTGIDGSSAIRTVNMFDDPNQVWNDSKDNITKYQDQLFTVTKTSDSEANTSDDPVNQIDNSPVLDGPRTGGDGS